jgi:hypothetical protein
MQIAQLLIIATNATLQVGLQMLLDKQKFSVSAYKNSLFISTFGNGANFYFAEYRRRYFFIEDGGKVLVLR